MTNLATKETLISLDSPEEWRRALDGIPHSFTHTWEHCYALHLTTQHPTFLYSLNCGEIRIVCPIAERSAREYVEVVTPWGFSGFAGNGEIPEFPSIWESFLRSRGYVTAYVTLNPLFHRPGFTNPKLVHQHNTLYLLDLNRSQEEIFAGLSKTRRQEIKKWLESDVTVVTEGDALNQFVIDQYEQTFRRKEMARSYWFSKSTMAALLSSPQIYVIGASVGAVLQSALICGYTQYSADALMNVGLSEGGSHLAGLIWRAATHFHEIGVPVLNLGGEIAGREGIAAFKRRFGTRAAPLNSLRQVVQTAVYNELCTSSACDTQSQDYFPPYQRNLRERSHCV